MKDRQPLDWTAEMGIHFGFLETELGFQRRDTEPSDGGRGSRFTGDVVQISIFYTQWHSAPNVSSTVSVKEDGNWLYRADLGRLVEAAKFAPMHRVIEKAHSAEAIRESFADQALWVKRLLPLLQSADGPNLIRKANEHQVTKSGNPKKRPPGIRWRYSS